MDEQFDFCGWATKHNLRCSDGRTILRDAFKHNDGQKVPLVWNHQHNEPENVLGHALLENCKEGVYARCSFNDTENGQHAKMLVEHGDILALSIYANQLKQNGHDVVHGMIREVSLVLASANPGAYIDSIIKHGEGQEETSDEAIIYTGEMIFAEVDDEPISHADDNKKGGKGIVEKRTIQDVIDEMTEEQRNVLYGLLGASMDDYDDDDDDEEEDELKHNIFDKETDNQTVLTHSDQQKILTMAKSSNCGSFKAAMELYLKDEALQHGFEPDSIDQLFPEYHDIRPGAPELLTDDLTWVDKVMKRVHKSPFTRIKTCQADARNSTLEKELRAFGYKKGTLKQNMGNIRLLNRTTDAQTVYVKDYMDRDVKLDITDFDVVAYIEKLMRNTLYEELATAILFGDNRQEGDPQKIEADKIRPIWGDDPLFTIYADVDPDELKTELQGDDGAKYFGDNFIFAEAIIETALYAREQYRGSGSLIYFCDPHSLNIMLLARDRNGHRVYKDISDLKAALNVDDIVTVEKIANKTRSVNATNKKLLGVFVDLHDYHLGSVKGGEINTFKHFDIDFNQEKFLMETRLSGALTRVKSAIVLEQTLSA